VLGKFVSRDIAVRVDIAALPFVHCTYVYKDQKIKNKILKNRETLLQTDLRFGGSSQSAVVVLIMTESLGGDPVHG
jgi:hypothetical protein